MNFKNKPIPADIIQQIKSITPETLEAHGVITPAKVKVNGHNTYICPECGNGKGDKGDGLVVYENSNGYRYHCYKCGENFGNFRLLGNYFDLYTDGKDFIEICKRTCREFGIYFDFDSDDDWEIKKIDLIKSDIETAHAAIFSVTSAVTRGLTFATLDKYHCGFLDNWTSTESRIEGKYATPTPRLIIPSGNHYLARLTVPLENYGENKRKYLREKQHEGTKSLFGIDFITSDTKTVIVTEGEIDSMSINQAINSKDITPVATCGAAEKKWINLFVKKCSQLNIKPKILILFDNDDAGKTNAPKRADELIKRGYTAVFDFLSDSDKKVDANDILQNQGEIALAETVQNIIQRRSADFDKLEKISSESALNPTVADSENNDFDNAEKEIAADEKAFDDEKQAAIEKIKNLSAFNNEVILNEEILKAAAFCKIYSPLDFSRLINDISKFNIVNPSQKVNVTDFKGNLKDYIKEIKQHAAGIKHRRAVLNAKKQSANFVSNNNFLNNITIPEPYSLTDDGVYKVVEEGAIQICRAPVVISRKIYSLEKATFKYVLSYQNSNKKWQEIPAITAATAANAKLLPALADFGLPFNSYNAINSVDYLDAYKFANEDFIPVDYSVSHCGWLNVNDEDFFIDPRWQYEFLNPAINSQSGNVIVDSDNFIAKNLKQSGSIDEWKKAFDAASISPVVVFMCYLSVAPFLLKILGERNFVFYLYGKTRGGKTTALKLATSAVGAEKLMFTFDATQKVIPELAANYTDYVLPIDEKQVADSKLQSSFATTIYALANGVGRIKLNKDSTIRVPKDWRNITLATGETPLLEDNVTGGAKTRLFSVPSPDTLLDEKACDFIRKNISKNFGLVFPRVLKLAYDKGNDFLHEIFNGLVDQYKKVSNGNILSEYCRYISVGVTAGQLFNMVLGDDEETAYEKAYQVGLQILRLTPTLDEISDIEKEKNLIRDFISMNQNHFVGGNIDAEKIQGIWGKFDEENGTFISVPAVKRACKESGFTYEKVKKDLIADGYLITGDDGQPIQKKIGGVNTRCFVISKEKT